MWDLVVFATDPVPDAGMVRGCAGSPSDLFFQRTAVMLTRAVMLTVDNPQLGLRCTCCHQNESYV